MRFGVWFVHAMAAAFAGAAAAQIQFTDATEEAGVGYLQHRLNPIGDCLFFSGLFCEPERFSGGVAVGDFDGDGLDDLFVTRLDARDLLFRNQGDGTFEEVGVQAGITGVHRTNGAAFVDVDNDGALDLYVVGLGADRSFLYINDGQGNFTEQAVERNAHVPVSVMPVPNALYLGYSVNVGDYDGDGYADLFVSFWRRGFSRLLRNRGDIAPGYFEDVTDQVGINGVDEQNFGFAATFTDLDRDGHLDLAIAADFLTSELFWNNGDGTFAVGTAAAGVGTDENGMGSAFGDFDGDGLLDWFVTSIYDANDTCATNPCNWRASGNRLYRNLGNRTFEDATDFAGVRDGAWGWGAAFLDADNSGALDLVMTNGADLPGNLELIAPFVATPLRFWRNTGNGAMVEEAAEAGLTDTRSGKGLVVLDYDNDGDLDVLVINNGDAPALYRNDTASGNDWLRVRFTGSSRAFEGLNAFITVMAEANGPAQAREMGVSTHFLGQSERVAHFGLGPASAEPVHEVRVEWPRTGIVQVFNEVARNQVFVITAPDEEVVEPKVITTHDSDLDGDGRISLSEVLRAIQLYNSDGYHIDEGGEDGFAPGPGPRQGAHHHADCTPRDWAIDLGELLRVVQFYNAGGYIRSFATEDGFAPQSA